MTRLITVAYGDGVGPEIMEATLHVLREAGAQLEIESIEIGQRVYNMGSTSGILPYAWDSLKRTGILLKGPTNQPQLEGCEDVSAVICEHMGIDRAARVLYHDDMADMPIAAACANEHFALFETLQEPMIELTGKNKADPCAMLHASVMMLNHIGQPVVATRIHHALSQVRVSVKKIKTRQFCEAVAEALFTPSVNQALLEYEEKSLASSPTG